MTQTAPIITQIFAIQTEAEKQHILQQKSPPTTKPSSKKPDRIRCKITLKKHGTKRSVAACSRQKKMHKKRL